MILEQQQLFVETLPRKPYCTNDLEFGLQIRAAKTALTKRHIQHNKPQMVSWIVLDLDSPFFWCLMDGEVLPPPNLVAFNPENHHCHIYYSLKTPVCRSNMARTKPLRYLAAIEYALREKWGADSGYSGLISKNPVHKHWKTIQMQETPWELGDLADWLPNLPRRLPRRAEGVGLGRNCTLFDLLRYWAYDSVLEYRVSGGFKTWQESVLRAAVGFNTFPEPLPINEVAATARSVSKWVWRNYTKRWTDEEFSRIQAERGKWGGIAKGKANAEKRSKAHELRAEGLTQRAIAEHLEVGQGTVSKWLKSKNIP